MANGWEREFRQRMASFRTVDGREGEVALSLKVRVESGCFHREHSPEAYAIIDERLASAVGDGTEFDFVEHESGPELLVVLELTAAGIALAASVIDLVAAIIGARREGVARGDHPSEPVQLIVRRIDRSDTFREERVLRIAASEDVDPAHLEALLRAALDRIAADETEKSE